MGSASSQQVQPSSGVEAQSAWDWQMVSPSDVSADSLNNSDAIQCDPSLFPNTVKPVSLSNIEVIHCSNGTIASNDHTNNSIPVTNLFSSPVSSLCYNNCAHVDATTQQQQHCNINGMDVEPCPGGTAVQCIQDCRTNNSQSPILSDTSQQSDNHKEVYILTTECDELCPVFSQTSDEDSPSRFVQKCESKVLTKSMADSKACTKLDADVCNRDTVNQVQNVATEPMYSNRSPLSESSKYLQRTEVCSTEVVAISKNSDIIPNQQIQPNEMSDDEQDGDEQDSDEEDVTGCNAGITLINSNIQADNVHIGDNYYLDRSLSNEAVHLEEEDFLLDSREALTGQYQTFAFCEVTLPFGEKRVHISKCLPLSMVELKVSDEDHLAQSCVNSLNDFAKLLANDVRRVLVEGPAGQGKSTFFMQIAYDWATNKIFADFELCFLVQGRKVTNSLLQTLLHQVRQKVNGEEELLKKAVRKAKGGVLLLIDGYDELAGQAKEEVDSLIRQQLLPSVTVVVSSRPHKCMEVLKNFQKRLILRGFSTDQIEEYSNNFSKGTVQKVYSIVRNQVHSLQSLLRSPLFLHFFCSVADEYQELQIIPSVTVLFTHTVRKALHRNGIVTRKLQDIEFLVNFGKLCLQNLRTDTVTFDKSDFSACCKNGSVDGLLGLGVIDKDYDWNSSNFTQDYVIVHKSIMEFLAALYLSTVIDTEDCSKYLCKVLNRKEGFQSLLPQFLVGLSAKRIEQVLKQLPRLVLHAQIFTICTLAIEDLESQKSLVKYLPKSLCINLNDGYVSVNNMPFSDSHYCHTSEVTVSSGEDIVPHDRQMWPRLLDLLSQEGLPVQELVLELDTSHTAAMDLAFQLFGALFVHSTISKVSMTAAKPTEELSKLLHNFRRLKDLKHLFLNIGHLRECDKFLDALKASSESSFGKLETLEVTYAGSSSLQLMKLCEVAATCNHLSSFAVDRVASCKSLAILVGFTAEAQQLRNLAVKFDTSGMSPSKSKWKPPSGLQLSKAVLDQLTSTALHSFFMHIADDGCYLTTLDLSHSCLNSGDIAALTSCVVQPSCGLSSLLLANCTTTKKKSLCIDLTGLVPQTKNWSLLDLSGWEILYGLEKGGTVSKLVAFDAVLRSLTNTVNSDVSVVNLFSVQELHCNLEDVFSTTNPFLRPFTPLLHLKVCCSSNGSGDVDLPKFFDSLQWIPKLQSLHLRCHFKASVSDLLFDRWSNLLSSCLLTTLHLELALSEDNNLGHEENLLKMAQMALQTALKQLTIVNVEVPFSAVWENCLPAFLMDVSDAFQAHSLKSLNLSQKPELHKEFLILLDQWEVQNKYKFCVTPSQQTKEIIDIVLQP